MPTILVNTNELGLRSSKISKTLEYEEIVEAIKKGIPSGKSIRTSFTKETIAVFKTKEKAALAFVQKINRDYKELIARVLDGDVVVSKREKK
jgi:hypothetical protein